MQPIKSILLTFDVEDWFQVENFKNYIPFSSWPERELRVESNTRRLLDVLAAMPHNGLNGTQSKTAPKATFFVLGWLAKRMPKLVRDIHACGHEIASHGFNHNLCCDCTPAQLREDLSESRKLLEDITGVEVKGYRAPSFSIGPDVLDIIEGCGYTYDSSFNSFAGNSRYGQLYLAQNGRGIAGRVLPSLYELPISNLKVGKYTIPMGGGGYFRVVPNALFKRAVRSIVRKQGAYLFYMHPWEIDPEQPRVKQLPLSYRFRHYINLAGTASKLVDFISAFGDCRFLTCREYLDRVRESDSRNSTR
jgi:polysaccharide deacetylase family protein (PEP-CTERM system associated)